MAMSRIHPLPLLLTLALAIPSIASAQATFKRKFEEGTKFKSQVSQKIDQVLTLNGMAIPTKSDTKIVMQTTYGKRDADGNLPIESKFESLQAELTLQGVTVKFDSARPDEKAANPIEELVRDQFRKVSGLVISRKISPDNKKVVSVERSKTESPVDPEDLKEQYQQDLDTMPDKPLKLGDKWERTVKRDLGQGQVFTFERTYEYAGQVNEFATVPGSRKLDKITASDSSVLYSVRPNAGMGLMVKKSDLKVESSKHTYLFDREAGRFVDEENEVRVTGKLALSINNMDLDGDLDLTLTTREQEVK
jgi:hypothetical protein